MALVLVAALLHASWNLVAKKAGGGAHFVLLSALLLLGEALTWRSAAGVRWGVLTGLLIACYTVLDGYAVKVVLRSPILVDDVGNLLRIPFMLPGALADRAGFVRSCKAQ